MSSIIVTPNMIELPTSLVEFLRGDKGICLQNDCYKQPCFSANSYNDLYKAKIIKNKSGGTNGINFKSPKIAIKNNSGVFTTNYMIELTNRLKHKEQYSIKTPADIMYPKGEGKLKNDIIVSIADDQSVLRNMTMIDNIIYMGVEFTMLAHLCKYDYKGVNDDRQLIVGLFKTISPSHYNNLLEKLDEQYYNLITNPPIWIKSDIVKGNYNIKSDDNNKYL